MADRQAEPVVKHRRDDRPVDGGRTGRTQAGAGGTPRMALKPCLGCGRLTRASRCRACSGASSYQPAGWRRVARAVTAGDGACRLCGGTNRPSLPTTSYRRLKTGQTRRKTSSHSTSAATPASKPNSAANTAENLVLPRQPWRRRCDAISATKRRARTATAHARCATALMATMNKAPARSACHGGGHAGGKGSSPMPRRRLLSARVITRPAKSTLWDRPPVA